MVETPDYEFQAPAPAAWRSALRDPMVAVSLFFIAALAVGALLGVVWALFAERPGYVVQENLGASLDERGLASIFGADALYSVIVALLGLAIGVASWLLFRRLGWWVCLVAVAAATVAAVAVWLTGLLVGQKGFQDRLAAASPGDIVAVDLQLHAVAAILLAPFFAITPVMLLAALWPDEPDVAAADELAGLISPHD